MIEPVGGHGGNEFYDFGLCEALGKYCDVGFYTCSETILHEKHHLKTKTYKFYRNIYGNTGVFIRGMKYLLASLRTVIHSRKEKADIAHVHIYHFAWREFITVFLCKVFFIKVVATIHDIESFSEDSNKWQTTLKWVKFFPFINQYIVHSRYAYQALQDISANMINKRLHLVPHGDTDFLYKGDFNKIDTRKSLLIPVDKKIILFFGQIKKVKGLDVLLNAFEILAKKNSAYHLLIIGRPWKFDGQLIKDRIMELGLENHVTLDMSYIANEQVPKYFAAADLVVLPYLKIYSSGVLLRALDYGTPAVVSDLHPLTDIIQDGENGRVFRSGDSEHLATVISEAIDAPVLLKKYAEAGQQTINTNYSWDVVARETMAVYRAT